MFKMACALLMINKDQILSSADFESTGVIFCDPVRTLPHVQARVERRGIGVAHDDHGSNALYTYAICRERNRGHSS